METIQVSVDDIIPNSRQPRKSFREESLRELADSIREVGVMQPLVVRAIGDGRYELIAGERRLRASRLAGLETVPVIVRAAGAQASLELALIENIQREDVAPLESARAYQELIVEFGLTQEQVAAKVGKSRAAVANTIRLLKLPERIQAGLRGGSITEGHARAILSLDGPARQLRAFDRIVASEMNVRGAEALSKSAARKVDSNLEAIEDALATRLGAPVRLTGKGKGKLEIAYFSDEDLGRILEALGVEL